MIKLKNDGLKIINSVVEIPKDSNAKYEYDPQIGGIVLDRCLISAMKYPVNYGFFPETLALDGDPLDVIIYSGVPLHPGIIVPGRAVGVLDMEDKGVKDYKVILVPSFNSKLNSIKHLHNEWLDVVADFFANYKNLINHEVKVLGWLGKKEADQIIKNSYDRYILTK